MTNTEILALAVTPQNTNVLYAGTQGSAARIYKTTNQGENWTAVYSSSNISINDIKVDPFSSSTVYAATSQGILKSTNAGSTWLAKNSGIGDLDIRAVAVDPQAPANRVYAATFGTFYISTDGGNSWTEKADGTETVFFGGISVYDGNVYGVTGKHTGLFASILPSGSSQWRMLASQGVESNSFFLAYDLTVDQVDGKYLYAAGRYSYPSTAATSGPKILRSTNSGVNWTLQYAPDWGVLRYYDAANAVAIDPNLRSIVYGVSHRHPNSSSPVAPVFYSVDDGVTWNYVTPHIEDYRAVVVDKSSGTPGSPSMIAYAGGGFFATGGLFTHSILKTTNGGSTWSFFNQGIPANVMTRSLTIDPTQSTIVYAAVSQAASGVSGGVLKSTNAGINWSLLQGTVQDPPNEWFTVLHHPNRAGVVYAIRQTNNWEVWQTIDGGINWSTMNNDLPDIQLLHLAFDTKPSTTYPRYLFVTTVGSVYWVDLAPFPPGNVQVANYNNNPRVTWVSNPEPDLPSQPYKVYRKIVEVGGLLIEDWRVIATVSGTSYVDGGITVGPKPNHYVVYYKLTATDLASTESAFSNQVAINAWGVNYKSAPNPEEELLPTSFGLSQNHPNPFNPSTQIRFDLPEASNVTLIIYDILGRQVAELAGGEYEAGYHSVTWNASSFASGVYLARFTARQIEGGQATDASGAVQLSTTRKLVLTK